MKCDSDTNEISHRVPPLPQVHQERTAEMRVHGNASTWLPVTGHRFDRLLLWVILVNNVAWLPTVASSREKI